MADVGESLSRVPLFTELSAKDLRTLAEWMKERTFSEGDTITEQGR